MDLSYFDGSGGLCGFSESSSDRELIKNALVLIEGTHKDNQGVIHEFPSDRLLRIAQKTNAAMSQGIEIPLMTDHSKQLIGDNGEIKKLGTFIAPFECRVIREEDLPNPKMRHLIGKLGAFSKAKILNKTNEVRSKLINLLSPGVDLRNERLAEVSAVAFPAIHGPALFAASPIQDLSFEAVKSDREAFNRQREELGEAFEIFVQTLERIQKASPEQLTAVSPEQLLSSAIDSFSNELRLQIGLNLPTEEQTPPPEPQQPYNANAYAQNLTQPSNASYSQQALTSEFNSVALKRRRKNR